MSGPPTTLWRIDLPDLKRPGNEMAFRQPTAVTVAAAA